MSKQKKVEPRVIESADTGEIIQVVRAYGLTSSGVGEWSGRIDGVPVLVRLVRGRDVARARLGRVAQAASARVVGGTVQW